MKRLTLCIALFAGLFSYTLRAQDIEGLELYATHNQVVAKFGQPLQYERTVIDDGPFLGTEKDTAVREDFKFDGLSLEVIDDRIITCKITTPAIKVMTNYVNGGLRVDDALDYLIDAINSFKTDKCSSQSMQMRLWYIPNMTTIPFRSIYRMGKYCGF